VPVPWKEQDHKNPESGFTKDTRSTQPSGWWHCCSYIAVWSEIVVNCTYSEKWLAAGTVTG